MSLYQLLTNVSAVQSAPTATRGPMNAVKAPGPSNPNMPPQEQTFSLSVSGVGAVAATAQLVVSHDGINWMVYNDPITASGTDTSSKITTGSGSWPWFGAYVTAISGTNASANLTMAA